MSHVARVELQIRDLDALAIACAALGLELMREQLTYRWFEGESACDHAIRQTKSSGMNYEIGVKARADGAGFDLLWDDFDRRLRESVGEGAGRLKQEYSAAVASRHWARNGYRVQRTTHADGRILLSATR